MLQKCFILIFLSILVTSNSAFAFSNCQLKYDNDKRSLPSLHGMCNVCHLSPNGAGPQNEFGRAFAQAGFKITDELVAKFPEFFQKSKTDEPTTSNTPADTPSTAPVIKRIKPKKVKSNVQSMITIMGQNFVDGAKAFLDNNEVLTTFKSNVSLVIDFILDVIGAHEVKIKNPDGQESNTLKIKVKK